LKIEIDTYGSEALQQWMPKDAAEWQKRCELQQTLRYVAAWPVGLEDYGVSLIMTLNNMRNETKREKCRAAIIMTLDKRGE